MLRVALRLFVTAAARLVFLAWSQTSAGTVRDQTGAAVPNDQVFLTDTATNVTLRSKSNEAGYYVFPKVLLGPYRLAVDAPAMDKFEAVLTVQVQQPAVMGGELRVSGVIADVSMRDLTPLVTWYRTRAGSVR